MLPMEKRNIIRQMVLNMRNEFLRNFQNVQWMAPIDKRNVEDKANALAIIVGEPESYFNERIYDEFIVDMVSMANPFYKNASICFSDDNRPRVFLKFTSPSKQESINLHVYQNKQN